MSEGVKKENILVRILKKLLKWIVIIIAMIAFVLFYADHRSDKKKEFYLKTWGETKALCNENTECIENAKAKFKECFKDNYYTEKKGRFNREDKIDKEGLHSCIKVEG